MGVKIWGKHSAPACIFCWMDGGWMCFFFLHSPISELTEYRSFARRTLAAHGKNIRLNLEIFLRKGRAILRTKYAPLPNTTVSNVKETRQNVRPFICNTELTQCHRFIFFSSSDSKKNQQNKQFFVALTWSMHNQQVYACLQPSSFRGCYFATSLKSLLKRTSDIRRNYFCLSIKNLLVALAKIKKKK